MLTDAIDAELMDACPELAGDRQLRGRLRQHRPRRGDSARGIPVGNTPDVLTDATADLAFALLLAAARGLPRRRAAVRGGDWMTWEPARYLGREVHGATLGIIGMGRIGRAVARRADGFAMQVIHTGRDGLRCAQLLQRADFVSLHCPLTPETRHLIDAAALGAMKPTAILINTARGPIVDPVALREALQTGAIAGAALDVTDPEPLPADDPLLTAPNLIVVPHIGSATTPRARGWPTWPSTTCSPRWPASRCPTRCAHEPDRRDRHRFQLDPAAIWPRWRTAASPHELERRSTVTRLGAGVDARRPPARRRDAARVHAALSEYERADRRRTARPTGGSPC